MAWLTEQAITCTVPGREFWWVAPILDQARIPYRRIIRGLPSNVYDDDKSHLRLTLANGAVLAFKGGDHPDSLYGDDVFAAVIDEGTRCKEDVFTAVRSTLTATRGPLRIIGNVKGRKNWAYHLARRVEAGNLPGWRYAKITAADAVRAGIITDAEVEAAKRELPEHVFRELYLAEPSEDGSNPFGLKHIAACVGPLSTAKPEVFGVDLGKAIDWTVVIGLDKDRRPCVFERWQHEPWEVTVNRLKSILGSSRALVDSSGVGDPIVETLQREGLSVEGFKFTQGSKQQLMEGLSLSVQRREVGILDGPMRAEMDSFEYEQSRTGVRYAAPEGLHDDCVVALALANERARRYVEVAAVYVSHQAPRSPEPVGDIYAWFENQRKDPNWGFGPSRWN